MPGLDNQIKIEHRLTSLEAKMDEISQNHLPHIREDIAFLRKMLWGLIAGELALLGKIIFEIIRGYISA